MSSPRVTRAQLLLVMLVLLVLQFYLRPRLEARGSVPTFS